MSRRPHLFPLLAACLTTIVLVSGSPAAAISPPAQEPASSGVTTQAVPSTGEEGERRRVLVDPPPRRDPHSHTDEVHARGAGIRKWPGGTIRYWADLPAAYQWSLDTAVDAWNRTGLDMRFVEAPRSKAKLTITIGNTHGASGYATIGYQARNWVHLAKGLTQPSFGESEAYARVFAARIIAHELGHNLGLDHTKGCQLMTAIVWLPDCRLMDADQPGYYACRIVDSVALGMAVGLYGGTRTQAPAACPVDRLPPALTGVRFEGGLEAEGPIRIAWDAPSKAPPGAQVLGFRALGETCTFPVVQDYYKTAVYHSDLLIKRLDPGVRVWQPPTEGIERHCYGLLLVNRSGAGRKISSQVMQSWVPRSPTPEVSGVRRFVGGEGSYNAVATWSGKDLQLLVLARPQGQCVTAWPASKEPRQHRAHAVPGEPFQVRAYDEAGDPIPNPCLSFFLVRDDWIRVGDAATWQVGAEPLPEPPTINSVTRVGADEYDADLAFDEDVASLATVVRPEGQCVTSWPGGDPDEFMTGSWVDTTGTPRPCLSFFTVNAAGEVSETATTWQAQAAPGPPAPSITHLVNDGGYVTGRTDLDPEVFGLAVVEGPTGQCPSSFPAGADPRDYEYVADHYYDRDLGSSVFQAYADGSNPCLTFFAYNLDGVVGPAVKHQL